MKFKLVIELACTVEENILFCHYLIARPINGALQFHVFLSVRKGILVVKVFSATTGSGKCCVCPTRKQSNEKHERFCNKCS
jgi:hypothetical protein